MFNKNFYPTPKDLINKVIWAIDTKEVKTVLEPSAGKGDIAEAIKNKINNGMYHNNFNDVDCIEIEPELQHILKGKKFRVVADDFLTFNTYKHYDLIIMNPPFDDGDKHLLKALEMQKNGGQIICLLNAETLKNPYTNTRKALVQQLNDYEAEIQYIKDAFLTAERKTDVEVALVKVSIEKKSFDSKILENLRRETEQAKLKQAEVEQEQGTNKVSRFGENNFIEMIVEQYNFEVNAGIRLIREYEAMQPMLMEKVQRTEKPEPYAKCILKLKLEEDRYSNDLTINGFIQKVRYKYWEALFNNDKFVGRLTDNLRTALYNKLDSLKDYDFSIYNIYTIQEELMSETIKGVEETILALFDELSNKWHWMDESSKNIHLFNGWKTNKAHKINKKVIIPLHLFNSWGSRDDYRAYGKLDEITKVFDYLDSGRTQATDIKNTLRNYFESGTYSKIPLKYFNATFYKKGTCHLEFTDLDLLDKFNLFGCQRKGWLPPNYGKKHYHDMNTEEQRVAKEFSGGEEEYNKIFTKQDFYLVEEKSLVPLLATAQ